MPAKEYMDLYSQLDLPFSETNQTHLPQIFSTLTEKFGLKQNSKQRFLDLGAGNGQVIIFCARNYGIRSKGIEINPILVEEAIGAIKALNIQRRFKKRIVKNIEIIQGDFYQHNLKNYDFIYIYSLPTMQKYLTHVFQTAKIAAIIISHMFPLKILKEELHLVFKLNHNRENHKEFTFFYRKA
ncbi:MAG: class I SAM-dependent methyltransferase [Promethearchaeota archaeon]|jgi:SAM-dependent methyltransferase